MDVRKTSIVEFLQEPRQFLVPDYVDTYKWKKERCIQLWNDLERIARHPEKSHFVGPITYVKSEPGASEEDGVPRLLLVDGQHLLVTFTLLLAAFAKYLEHETAEITPDVIKGRCLSNRESGEGRRKLVLQKDDADVLACVLDKGDTRRRGSRITLNYIYFERALGQSEMTPDVIYSAICRMNIIDVALDPSRDNPQLVLEGLDCKGPDLAKWGGVGSAVHVIRNHIMMNLGPDRQDAIYENVWLAIEADTETSECPENFEQFVRCYLTARTGVPPGDTYAVFKAYLEQAKSVEELARDMRRMALFYRRIVMQKDEPDEDLGQIIHDMHHLDAGDTYPFLMGVYSDYDSGLLSRDDILEIFSLMESYLLRRVMCYVGAAKLDKMLAGLLGEINKERYLESFKGLICTQTASNRFPPDKEFLEKFVTRNVYETKFANYLLSSIERRNGDSWIRVGDYTPVHVMMPEKQNLSKWEEYQLSNLRWSLRNDLHSAGNLTLAGSDLDATGKRSFAARRDMKGGFADSPLWLNRDVARYEHWDMQTIKERSKSLAKMASEIWPYPDLPADVLARYSRPAKVHRSELCSEDKYLRLNSSEKTRRIYHRIKPYLLEKFPYLNLQVRRAYAGMYSDDDVLICQIKVGQTVVWVSYTTRRPISHPVNSLVKTYRSRPDEMDPDAAELVADGSGVRDIIGHYASTSARRERDGRIHVAVELREESQVDHVFLMADRVAALEGL